MCWYLYMYIYVCIYIYKISLFIHISYIHLSIYLSYLLSSSLILSHLTWSNYLCACVCHIPNRIQGLICCTKIQSEAQSLHLLCVQLFLAVLRCFTISRWIHGIWWISGCKPSKMDYLGLIMVTYIYIYKKNTMVYESDPYWILEKSEEFHPSSAKQLSGASWSCRPSQPLWTSPPGCHSGLITISATH